MLAKSIYSILFHPFNPLFVPQYFEGSACHHVTRLISLSPSLAGSAGDGASAATQRARDVAHALVRGQRSVASDFQSMPRWQECKHFYIISIAIDYSKPMFKERRTYNIYIYT